MGGIKMDTVGEVGRAPLKARLSWLPSRARRPRAARLGDFANGIKMLFSNGHGYASEPVATPMFCETGFDALFRVGTAQPPQRGRRVHRRLSLTRRYCWRSRRSRTPA